MQARALRAVARTSIPPSKYRNVFSLVCMIYASTNKTPCVLFAVDLSSNQPLCGRRCISHRFGCVHMFVCSFVAVNLLGPVGTHKACCLLTSLDELIKIIRGEKGKRERETYAMKNKDTRNRYTSRTVPPDLRPQRLPSFLRGSFPHNNLKWAAGWHTSSLLGGEKAWLDKANTTGEMMPPRTHRLRT